VSYELTQALDEAAARFAPQIDPTMADAAYLFDRWRDQLRARREAGGSGVGWGIPEIDRHGELWPSYGLLLGRTSHGKTAVACQSALGKAWQGTPAVIASLEQPRPQVVARLLCLLTGLPWRVVLGKDGTPEALAIVDRALTWLRTTPNLTVIDGRRTVDQIIGCARRLRDQGKCDILYIDQMSRIDHQQHPREHMEQAWTRTSNRIARAWQELQIPIVLLAQLNIKSADEHAEPALSQVKNCGTMGEDCCWCLLIDRPEAEPARFAKLEAERGRLISKGKYQEATDVDYRGKVKLHCVKDRASNLGGEWTEVLPFDRTCGRIGGPIQAVAAAAAEQEA
jgi:replicative DNA helicase